jgi:deoxyribodipyrimidine photo-lyase
MSAAIVWFRRDLRLHEHPALRAALDAHERMIPAFCLDDRLLHGRHASGPRTQFLLESLADLDSSLRSRGSALVVLHGAPERELGALAARVGAEEIHFTADVSPFARRRGARVHAVLEAAGVGLHGHPGLSAIDDIGEPRTQAGRPYSVFSAFHRSWERQGRREVLGAPPELPALPAGVGGAAIPSLKELGLRQEVSEPAVGGERHGRERLERFLADGQARYDTARDEMCAETSRLSPYLHFGCISAREAESRLGTGAGPAAFRRQLCWRDFYHHVLLSFPRNARSEFQARYRGTIPWSRSERLFAAWCEGRTGYPLVDAGMRQLHREGWMHNRARLLAGSFLTKDLGIDWRWGERFFMRMLIDGDAANNNGNWQWIASVGTDPQPAYRRILSPTRQMAAHDPEGRYVRHHLPELANVPARYLREPWTMPAEVQRQVGCVIGSDYPQPIVDHVAARRRALERYRLP